MTVARSVADVLDDHVVFEVESIDRMYLNVWQPRLAYGGGVQGFFVGHRGYHYASTALMDPMTKDLVADIHWFVAARGLELVSFDKGQRKDELTQEFLARFTDDEGVLFVGRAQEKAGVWRTPTPPQPGDCGAYASTDSSTASPTPAATRSPTPDCTTPCSSPTPTTTCCAPDSPRSPTPTHPLPAAHHHPHLPSRIRRPRPLRPPPSLTYQTTHQEATRNNTTDSIMTALPSKRLTEWFTQKPCDVCTTCQAQGDRS
ncbi:MAG: hypothetical protein ACRDRH_13000 [Pseudonocardia sp.]